MKTKVIKRITLKTGLKVYHLTNGNKTVVLIDEKK